jgi:hypothetical protein
MNKKLDRIIEGLINKFANSCYSSKLAAGTLNIFKCGYLIGKSNMDIDDIDMSYLYILLKSNIKMILKNM